MHGAVHRLEGDSVTAGAVMRLRRFRYGTLLFSVMLQIIKYIRSDEREEDKIERSTRCPNVWIPDS